MAVASLAISGIVAILLGILVLVFPGLLRWAVGLWLIITGLTQILS